MAAPLPLIADDEPSPVESVNPEGKAPVLLICDHASHRIPRLFGKLGVPEKDLRRHVAWDIGAGEVTRRLARTLDCPALLGGYSRLVIDINRQPGHPQSIPEVSDDVSIPANMGLSEAEQEARVQAIFRPYHNAITAMVAHLWRRGPAPTLFSVHSFTPSMGGKSRPWDIGVLWNRDPRIAVPLLDRLRREPGLRIGDNEPYSGRVQAYSLDRHGTAAGLPACAVEIRQDHLETTEGIAWWADLLADALRGILTDTGLHQVARY
jgi:predicted N-formylglutamate amidohydrolase